MPLPVRVARITRRLVNPMARTFAGRVPPFAMVVHVGRKSGKTYHTPMMVFRTDGGFVFALTYGRERTDWLKNVEAAGGCRLIYRGREIALDHPRVVHGTEGRRYMPALVWFVLRLLGVNEFLRMDRGQPTL
jgi:deazaflavin-dependent oxidoreductase (nitroreductase family)